MRLFSILAAIVVIGILYALVFERDSLRQFAGATSDVEEENAPQTELEDDISTVSVVAFRSDAAVVENGVVLRGRTEAARQVEVRAETGGLVISEPLRRGAFVEAGELVCRLDPGTREVTLAEANARLAEAKSRVPEAEARVAEAESRVPAVRASLNEATSRVPAAEAALAEAKARVPAAQANLAEAMSRVPAIEAALGEAQSRIPAARAALAQSEAGLPAAEARVREAQARLAEAKINLNAAEQLFEDGFASDTRVAAARSAAQAAEAGVQNALSDLEGARARIESARSDLAGAQAGAISAEASIDGATAAVENARSQLEGARANVISAESQVEGAKAAIESVKSQIDGALAGVESANSQVESAKSGIQSAEAAVAAARKDIERLEIRSPFAGLLETDSAELGALMQPGSLCATVIQLDPIKLVGFVPETMVDRVSVDASAGARLASGREIIGKVIFLSRSADETTRTFRVEVEVENSDWSIRDGQTAEILIQAPGQAAHLIPQSALTLDDDGRLGVRLVNDDRQAAFSTVEILRDTEKGVWVAGLADQVDIIVVGQEFVTDGVPVDVTYRESIQ